MRQEVGNKARTSTSSVRSALRGIGRVAIWVVVGLLLVRGIFSAASTAPPQSAPTSPAGVRDDQASESFAIRFARAYLADPSTQALAPFLADEARVGTGRPPEDDASPVAQAEVSRTKELAGGAAVLTVACELRDARTLYLAVPITRSRAGEVAALGAPSIVAAPGVAGADSDQPQPLAGPEAGSIQALVTKFVPEYVAAGEASDLAYLVAPGTVIQPLAGALRFVSVSGVTQLGSGEGPRRSILAAVRVVDPATGAAYPLVYRIAAVKGARWYVRAIEGASA